MKASLILKISKAIYIEDIYLQDTFTIKNFLYFISVNWLYQILSTVLSNLTNFSFSYENNAINTHSVELHIYYGIREKSDIP